MTPRLRTRSSSQFSVCWRNLCAISFASLSCLNWRHLWRCLQSLSHSYVEEIINVFFLYHRIGQFFYQHNCSLFWMCQAISDNTEVQVGEIEHSEPQMFSVLSCICWWRSVFLCLWFISIPENKDSSQFSKQPYKELSICIPINIHRYSCVPRITSNSSHTFNELFQELTFWFCDIKISIKQTFWSCRLKVQLVKLTESI